MKILRDSRIVGRTAYGSQVAIIIGAVYVIGAEITMSLARQGVQILIAETDRPGGCQARATADRVKHETAVQRVAAQTDVSRRDQVERFVAGTAEEFGRIRILVHNAGDRPLAALLADHRRPMGAELGG